MLTRMSLHRVLLNLLYPPACLLCRAGLTDDSAPAGDGPLLCRDCTAALPRNGPPVCARCGLELRGAFDAVMICLACRTRPPAFEMARAPWRYAGPAQAAVRQFKYHRRWRLGTWLAEEMARTARASLPLDDVDAVLAVPPHWLRHRLRGFDHAGALARAVARSLEKPYAAHALRRVRWTATQTRRPWRARARNVQGAFAASPRRIRRRTLLLVDDVLTSGATAGACATALKEAGARRVVVLTAARTPLA